MNEKRATDEELAREAQLWESGAMTPSGWEDAPGAVPRVAESVPISIRLPRRLLAILKEFARRKGVGYQVLIKRWLDERIRHEHKLLRENARHEQQVIKLISPTIVSHAASFDARTVPSVEGNTGQVEATGKDAGCSARQE
jgi:hypothetical protein